MRLGKETQMKTELKPFAPPIQRVIDLLRETTAGTQYEGELFLVGGLLRDRELGLSGASDLDLVLEGDAVELAKFLHSKGVSRHFPVLYPRFGTAMLTVGTEDESFAIELVSARAESYHPDSRKPDVRRGTIREDVLRRDFTINTLLENLHSGERLDLTGRAISDLEAGILKTPLEPRITFFDDPLRMLRAIRFAARFEFEIEAETWDAICEEAGRLRPPAIAFERIRDEFVKIAALPGKRFRRGMELLKESNLLPEFLPEMAPMMGCTQGGWHPFDVWEHTLTALECLPDSARVEARLGLLWHDIGKPPTRSVEPTGVRFYGHPVAGAELTRAFMTRLKFSNEEIRDVVTLVRLHMRLGDYRPEWPDGTLKRLIRDCGAYLDEIFILTKCDQSACRIPPEVKVNLAELRKRIDTLNALTNVLKIDSPLDGIEIMRLLNAGEGKHLRDAKEHLVNEVIEGRLAEGDKDGASRALLKWWSERD